LQSSRFDGLVFTAIYPKVARVIKHNILRFVYFHLLHFLRHNLDTQPNKPIAAGVPGLKPAHVHACVTSHYISKSSAHA